MNTLYVTGAGVSAASGIPSFRDEDGFWTIDSKNYIAIHGRLDQMTLFHHQGDDVKAHTTPWDNVDESRLHESLLELFNIENQQPVVDQSLKPFVLLFDEYYTELYRISQAQQRMLCIVM
ncbi:hypothetical protein PSOS111911_10230 [Pseudoalteromonas ostreae]